MSSSILFHQPYPLCVCVFLINNHSTISSWRRAHSFFPRRKCNCVPCTLNKTININLVVSTRTFLRQLTSSLNCFISKSIQSKMASMNYCFTVCRATDEKVQQETHSNTSTTVDTPPNSASPSTPGAYFFGRFFSFGSSPPTSTSTLSNAFAVKAAGFADIDENLF